MQWRCNRWSTTLLNQLHLFTFLNNIMFLILLSHPYHRRRRCRCSRKQLRTQSLMLPPTNSCMFLYSRLSRMTNTFFILLKQHSRHHIFLCCCCYRLCCTFPHNIIFRGWRWSKHLLRLCILQFSISWFYSLRLLLQITILRNNNFNFVYIIASYLFLSGGILHLIISY